MESPCLRLSAEFCHGEAGARGGGRGHVREANNVSQRDTACWSDLGKQNNYGFSTEV